MKWLADPIALTAISTVVIATFTIMLTVVGWFQARLTREAIAVSRDEFNATQRPRIIVRQFDIETDADGTPFRVKFVAVNTGSLTAFIYQSNVTVVLAEVDKLPAAPAYSDVIDLSLRTLKNGEVTDMAGDYFGDGSAAWFGNAVFQKEGRGPRTLVFGFVRYRDYDGLVRETAFCRAYTGTRFVEVGNPDYEYSY